MPDPTHTAPTVTIATKPPRTVVFDFDRLVAIEEATCMGINDVCDALQKCLGNEEKGIAPKLSLKFVRAFVAGCLDCPVSGVSAALGNAGVKRAFNELVSPFAAAIAQLSDKEDADSPPPVAGSGASVPGPASISESAPTNSAE